MHSNYHLFHLAFLKNENFLKIKQLALRSQYKLVNPYIAIYLSTCYHGII